MEDRESRFGRIAVEMGLVTQDQIEDCQRISSGSNPAKSMSQVLVETGVLTIDQFFTVMRQVDSQTGSKYTPRTSPGFSGGLNPKALLGQQFARYMIIEELGRGGMGVVFKARDEELGRTVALKILRDAPGGGGSVLKRFQREAQMASKLRHPNIVSVHDVGTYMDAHYFTMDYIEGASLDHVAMRGSLSVPQTAAIMEDVARAVHYAHQNGVIHRDLKPANIMMDGSRRPYVMDFGLAKNMEAESKFTRTGQALGTPLYMSPEQVRGNPKDIKPATDVYALGVILYEMLTGRAPHQGRTAVEIYKKILDQDPAPPRTLKAGIPIDLETICLKSMAKEPGKRYPSAHAFADDLARFRRGDPIMARPSTAWEKFTRRVVRRRTPIAISVLAVLLAATVGLVIAARRRGPAIDPERERIVNSVISAASHRINQAAGMAGTEGFDPREATEKTLAALEDLLRQYPDAHQAYFERGRALMLRDDGAGAERAFTKSLSILPTATAYYQRGRLFMQQYIVYIQKPARNQEQIDAMMRESAALEKKVMADFADTLRCGALGDEKALSDAFLAYLEKRHQDVVDGTSKLLSSTERFEEIYLLRGWALDSLDRRAEAEKDFSEVLRLKPLHLLALTCRAGVRYRSGRIAEALADMDTAIKIRPEDTQLYRTRAQYKSYSNDPAGAIDDVQTALKMMPDDPFLLDILGAAYHYAGKFREAVEAYNRALELYSPSMPSTRASTLTNRGWAKRHLRDIPGAIADYEAALALRPDENAYANLAEIRLERGDVEGALRDYTKALELRPACGPWYLFRANIHRSRGRTQEWLADVDQAIAKTVGDPRHDKFFVAACLARAEHHFSRQDSEKGMADYRLCMTRVTVQPEALLNRGLYSLKLEQYEECARDLEKYVEIVKNPDPKVRAALEQARRHTKNF